MLRSFIEGAHRSKIDFIHLSDTHALHVRLGGSIYAFFKQINLSHCAQASSRSKKHAQFFCLFSGPQIGWLQPLIYPNFELKEKFLKN